MLQYNIFLIILFGFALVSISYLIANESSSAKSGKANTRFGLKFKSMNISETILKTDNLSICVPHYNLLLKYLVDHKPREPFPNVSINPLSAFQFPTHSVITLRARDLYGSRVYCRYFDVDRKEIGKAQKSVIVPDYVVYCCRRIGTKFMTLTKTSSEEATDLIQMIDRLDEKPKNFLGMCLGPIHEKQPKWLLLAELIEHYKLQGVTHFYLYIKDSDDYLNRLLFDYERTGEATLIWLGYENDRPGIEWHLQGMQECVIRSRMHSEYSIFADLDERIMPVNKTLAQFVKDVVAKRNSTASLQFRPRWLLRVRLPPNIYEGEKTMNNDLPILVFHNTSMWPDSPSHTCKTVVNPMKILSMWVHYPEIFLPGYNTYEVPPETGIVWHYRELKADNWGTTWLREVEKFGNFTNTSYPEPLLSQVYKQVKNRLDRVYPQKNVTNG